MERVFNPPKGRITPRGSRGPVFYTKIAKSD